MPGTYVPTEYLPILIFLFIGAIVGFGSLIVGQLFRIRRPYDEKLTPYESGNPPVGETRKRFSVTFYIIAMLFVVFDVEAIFLYPWAIVFDKIGMYAYVEMLLFMVILVVGYVYAFKKEAFRWEM